MCRQGLGSPRRSGGESCQATLGVRSAWEQSRVPAQPPADGPASLEGVRALCALDDANGRLDGGLSHGKPSSKASSWKATAVIPAGKGQAWGALGEWTELGDSWGGRRDQRKDSRWSESSGCHRLLGVTSAQKQEPGRKSRGRGRRREEEAAGVRVGHQGACLSLRRGAVREAAGNTRMILRKHWCPERDVCGWCACQVQLRVLERLE